MAARPELERLRSSPQSSPASQSRLSFREQLSQTAGGILLALDNLRQHDVVKELDFTFPRMRVDFERFCQLVS